MAHLQGFKPAGLGNVLAHVSRHKDARGDYVRFGNSRIDPARTPFNYNLAPDWGCSQRERIDGALARYGIKPRSNQNVVSSWLVTLPEGFPEGREREFFDAAYSFLASEVGGECNVVSAWVHVDETTPHMHFLFLPLVLTERTKADKARPLIDVETGDRKRDSKGAPLYERSKTGERRAALSQAKMFPRARLAGFHERLSASLAESLGFDTGVVLADGDPKKALSAVSHGELDAAARALDAELAEARGELAAARAERDALAAEVSELKEEKRRFAADLGEFLDALLHGGYGWEAVAARLCLLAKQGNPIAQAFARAFNRTGAYEQGERAAVAHVRERATDGGRGERCR
ncbi:plasmid recombination protein [Eggerthella sinensis]|uniref:plasmid recombination protein n=1 Tax=Eggerthella sinensis TaxID=242230 RepID=UPI0029CA0E14|nr:plasmid recombination protein [Eggerthella sinensis]